MADSHQRLTRETLDYGLDITGPSSSLSDEAIDAQIQVPWTQADTTHRTIYIYLLYLVDVYRGIGPKLL